MIAWTLARLKGSPARMVVTPSDPPGPSDRQSGMLALIEESQLVFELLDLPLEWAKSGGLQVEVFHACGLFRFQTRYWRSDENPRSLHTALPERIEVVQRRRNPRVDLSHTLSVQRAGAAPTEAAAVNLSASGVAFIAPLEATLGEQVEIRLGTLATSAIVPLVARIVRVGTGPTPATSLFGAHFVSVSPETQAAIRDYVNALAAQTEEVVPEPDGIRL